MGSSTARDKAKARQLAKRSGERINQALQHAGVSPLQLERLLLGKRRARRDAGIVAIWRAGDAVPSDAEYLAIANVCQVDVRWLATGKPSAAGISALQSVQRLIDSASAEVGDVLRGLLLVAREPSRGMGVCRYCNCSHYDPCAVGCAWLDEEETICTACLLTDEERGHG